MKEYQAADIRNFAVVGHASSGKTMLCEAMRPYGLTANLEFMPWTAVPHAQSALRIVTNAGMPSNAGILVDALHFGRSTTSLDDIRAIPRQLLHYAQICDAQAGLNFSTEEFKQVTHIDKDAWMKELALHDDLFAQLDKNLPKALADTRARIEQLLSA